MDYNEFLQKLQQLLQVAGNITLSEAVTWLEVKENAEALKAEGHESNPE